MRRLTLLDACCLVVAALGTLGLLWAFARMAWRFYGG